MDLSALLQPIRNALGAVRPRAGEAVRIGVGDAAKAATIAALARDLEGPLLIAVSRASKAQDLYEELGSWLGRDDAGRLRLYPQRDILPYERVADDPWDVRARLEATSLLHGDTRPIIV